MLVGLRKKDRIEERGFRLLDEIKQQEERIEKLEDREENKALGLNRQGNGLEMSVANIPRIEEESEGKFEESSVYRYRATTDEAKAYVQKLLSMQKEINGGVTVG